MDVTIVKVTEPDELYCKYPGQFQPQPVDLELNTRTGVLSCFYAPETGGATSFDHFHRIILSASIPCLTADVANALMDEVAPLAQRVLDGASEEWDGNNNVGVLTDDAAKAWADIDNLCATYDAEENPRITVAGWDVSDWFAEGDESTIATLGITADTTDAELDTLATDNVEQAKFGGEVGYGVLDHDATLAYLTQLRDDLRQAACDELRDNALEQAMLKERIRHQIRRLAAWRDQDGRQVFSSRAIEEIVGLSHTRVQQIIKEPTT
jgi:hypothetical protein